MAVRRPAAAAASAAQRRYVTRLMPFEITSIYQLLDLARDRPAMYGVAGRSFRLLQSFLGGLGYADLDVGDPPFWDFDWWATVRTDHFPTSMPWHWLRHQSDEDAYATWFGLLDEYRGCWVVELARLPGTVVRFGQHWHGDNGKPLEPYVPPTPQVIRLGRFAPSDVYFVEQVFADHGKKLVDGFQPTAEQALNAARWEWQVDPAAWNAGRAGTG